MAVSKFIRASVFLLILGPLDSKGLAQSSIITTYAGPQMPLGGTQATTQVIDRVQGVVPDGIGGFYVSSSSQHRVYRVSAGGVMVLWAGSGTLGFGGDGGPALSARLDTPMGLAVDPAGNLYIADSGNNRIRKVTPAGVITTVAGTGTLYAFGGDGGPATLAQLSSPRGVAVDAANNLYIADAANRRIRKVTSSGIITTVAGDGQPFILDYPSAVATDTAGNVYIADTLNHRVCKLTSTGEIATVAGIGSPGFSGDGGPALSAQLYDPVGIAVDPGGNIYVADSDTSGSNISRIRKVVASGTISTMLFTGPFYWSVAFDPASNSLYTGALFGTVADDAVYSGLVYRVTDAGAATIVAGRNILADTGDSGLAAFALFDSIFGLAIDSSGDVYFGSRGRVRKVTPAGIISAIAGNGSQGFSGDGGPATSAQLNGVVTGMIFDSVGTLYFTDSGNCRVRKVGPEGVIDTVAGTGTCGFGGDGGPASFAQIQPNTGNLAVDSAGNLFISDELNNRVRKVTPAGVITTVAGNGTVGYGGDGGPSVSAQVGTPGALALDAAGNLYIAQHYDDCIRKVDTSGLISTIAGRCGINGGGGDGGPATSAYLASPSGLAIDLAGNLYVVEAGSRRVFRITPNGIISTVVAGRGQGFSGDGGLAISAQIGDTTGLALEGTGDLYIAEYYPVSRIRKVTNIAAPVPNPIIATAASMPAGSAGLPYIAALTTDFLTFGFNNGNSVTNGILPPGLTLNEMRWGSVITGSPTTPGTYDFTVQIHDYSTPRIASKTFHLTVSPWIGLPFSLPNRGGAVLTTAGTSTTSVLGYGAIALDPGSATASGVAIFTNRQNGVIVSEAGAPASAAIQNGRIYVEAGGPVNTGIAIANPNAQDAVISFFFTDLRGESFGSGTTTIPASRQISKFLNESPFNGGSSLQGTFTFTSSVPVSVIALRGFTNERGEFLMTTLPVADTLSTSTDPVVLPHFADGGGWITSLLLVNTTESDMTGSVQFFSSGTSTAAGQPLNIALGTSTDNIFFYTLRPRSSQKLVTVGAAAATTSGSVLISPSSGQNTPTALAVFSFKTGGMAVSEAGVPSNAGSAFDVYVEASGALGAVGSIQSGIALANRFSSPVAVNFELTALDGALTGLTTSLVVPAQGQVAKFLGELFPDVPASFRGVLHLSTAGPDISVVGLRARYNERGDFLITTTPPVNEASASSNDLLFFPLIADGAGYSTQFILFSGQQGQSLAGTVQVTLQAGGILNLPVQ